MSPFKSYKQRTYLKKNVPSVYLRWKRKYGTTVVKGDSKKRGTTRRKKRKP